MFRFIWKSHSKRKALAKGSGQSPFPEFLGFQSDALEFLNVKCMDEYVEHDDLTETVVKKQISKKGVKKNVRA